MNKQKIIDTKCKSCEKDRETIDGLCDDCTIKKYGRLFPWLDKPKTKSNVKELYIKQFRFIRFAVIIDKSEIYLPTIEFSNKPQYAFKYAVTIIIFCLFISIAFKRQ